MRLTMLRRPETCPTCQQPIVPPTPSKVVLVRVGMAAFAVGSGLLEYRRALRREIEAAQLEQLHETSPDVPLDEHLEQREPSPVDMTETIRQFADEGITATPWPPSHPSLAAVDDALAEADGTD